MCSVKVKVVESMSMVQVQTKYGPRNMKKVVVADSTASMMLCLWENQSTMVSTGDYYSLQDVVTSTYQGQLQLSATAKTKVERIQQFHVTDASVAHEEVFVGSVLCCTINVVNMCMNCNKLMEDAADKVIQKCNNCHSKQRVSKRNTKSTLHLKLDVNGSPKKIAVFDNVLRSFMEVNKISHMNKDEVENFILMVDLLKVKTLKNSDVAIALVKLEQTASSALTIEETMVYADRNI